MKKTIILSIMFIFLLYAVCEADQHYKLLVNKLDYRTVTRDLPIRGGQKSTSDNGRIRQRWHIQGNKLNVFEIIGNDQRDADKVCWHCHEFNPQGNRIKASNPERFCHRFFIKVLKNIVTNPEKLALYLINKGEMTYPQSAILKTGDISIETDGVFYALRRASRLKKDF